MDIVRGNYVVSEKDEADTVLCPQVQLVARLEQSTPVHGIDKWSATQITQRNSDHSIDSDCTNSLMLLPSLLYWSQYPLLSRSEAHRCSHMQNWLELQQWWCWENAGRLLCELSLLLLSQWDPLWVYHVMQFVDSKVIHSPLIAVDKVTYKSMWKIKVRRVCWDSPFIWINACLWDLRGSSTVMGNYSYTEASFLLFMYQLSHQEIGDNKKYTYQNIYLHTWFELQPQIAFFFSWSFILTKHIWLHISTNMKMLS